MKQNYLFINFIKLFTLFSVFLLLYSCEKDELDFSEPVADEAQAKDNNNFTNFRCKVENPLYNFQYAKWL